MLFTSVIFAQYEGQPWTGTPWTFGTDNLANFTVGKTYLQRPDKTAWFCNGIPHFLYDVGKVDTTMRPGDDLAGTLVAGAAWSNSDRDGATNQRVTYAGTDGITIDPTELSMLESVRFRGLFTSHNNRGVFDRQGGWYRYTCNFADGNYKLVLRTWNNDTPTSALWIRFYDKATMTPLYPWTRIHAGGKNGDESLQEGMTYVSTDQAPYDGNIDKQPSGTTWVISDDQFSLNGTVVLEISDIGPSEAYGLNVQNSGGTLDEISFSYIGAAADNFAPVAEPWKDVYDEMDENISLTLSEAGTLYLVPAGTIEEDIETAKIDKKEMTGSDTYSKAISDFELTDQIQLVTKDATGNMRFTAPISFESAITTDTISGSTGDTISVNVTRDGFVILAPNTVNADLNSFLDAIAQGNADTVNVSVGGNALAITNLSGNKDCSLYLIEETTEKISNPAAFTLTGTTSAIDREISDVTVYSSRGQIIIDHNYNGNFKEAVIYDIFGRQHIKKIVNSGRISINSSHLSDGVYILKMSGESAQVTKKFLIQR